MLPFTTEAFFALFEEYNRAIWPAQIAAYALGAAALGLTLWPVPAAGRMVSAALAALWAWTGVAYHLLYFSTINFAAPQFAALFFIQALLFAWTGVVKGRLAFRFRHDLFGWAGLGAGLFALVLYPLLGWLAGHVWPRAAVFGVTPCPTTIFTLGALLLVQGRTPLHLAALPVLWSLIGGSAVLLLDVPEDLSLPITGLGGLALILWKNRREGARSSPKADARGPREKSNPRAPGSQ